MTARWSRGRAGRLRVLRLFAERLKCMCEICDSDWRWTDTFNGEKNKITEENLALHTYGVTGERRFY